MWREEGGRASDSGIFRCYAWITLLSYPLDELAMSKCKISGTQNYLELPGFRKFLKDIPIKKGGILEAGEACQNRGSPVVSTLCYFRVTQKRNAKMHFWESSRRQKHV